MGPSATRNYIIEKATGEFILMLDSDDWLESDAIEKLVETQCKFNCDIVKFSYYINSDKDKIIKSVKYNKKYADRLLQNKEECQNELIKDILLGNIPAYTWAMFIKRELIREELYFEKEINHMEDKVFLIKLLSNVKNIYFSNLKLYHYFINTEGLMHKYKYDYYLEKDIEVHTKIDEIIKKYYNEDKKLISINNTMSTYAIERNIFNIYKTKGKQEMLKKYNEIKEYWKKISKETNYKYLNESRYTLKGDYFIKILQKENINNIIKKYNREIFIEKIKYRIKSLLRR